MNEDQNQPNDTETSAEDAVPDELAMLKTRARMMGVMFSNNISVEALKRKIEEKMEGKAETPELSDPIVTPLVDPAVQTATATGSPQTMRQRIIKENMRLIRLRITNMDPKKKDLPGEVFTVANQFLGTVRKFVPYGEVTEDGYHVPYCIYKQLKSRKFLNIRTSTDKKNNNQIKVQQQWAPEFSLEILPQLTQAELNQLAAAQSAAGSLG